MIKKCAFGHTFFNIPPCNEIKICYNSSELVKTNTNKSNETNVSLRLQMFIERGNYVRRRKKIS